MSIQLANEQRGQKEMQEVFELWKGRGIQPIFAFYPERVEIQQLQAFSDRLEVWTK
ncbi:hypothetical protein [Collimonas pratensis]|uniref:Uncharacterized protein n=1 Tax=Collimonas pratensis TaxID=279113 RepID=A0ABM5Z144_9BURK|nr:hypothetical protein [Collimonas pratensis]AMP12759.1 hypothetical protein CPter291_0473 [Collimonas pratensis]